MSDRICHRCELLAEADALGTLQAGACSPNERWHLEELEDKVLTRAHAMLPCEECRGEFMEDWL